MNESNVKKVINEMVQVLGNVAGRNDVGKDPTFFFGGSLAALEMLAYILDGKATVADFAENCEMVYFTDHILGDD